jgi:hypothetical protein
MSKNINQSNETDIFNLVNEDDLTPDLIIMADICGLESVRQMLRQFPGMGFYIPKLSRLDGFVNRYIKENTDKPVKILAKDLKVSEQYLKKICRERRYL